MNLQQQQFSKRFCCIIISLLVPISCFPPNICKNKEKLLVIHNNRELHEIDLDTLGVRRLFSRSHSLTYMRSMAVDYTGTLPAVYVSEYYSSSSSNRKLLKMTYDTSHQIHSEEIPLRNSNMKCEFVAFEPLHKLLYCGTYEERSQIFEIAADGSYKLFRFEGRILNMQVHGGALYINLQKKWLEQVPIPLEGTTPKNKIYGWPVIDNFHVTGDTLYYSYVYSAGKPWFYRTQLPDAANRESFLPNALISSSVRPWTIAGSSIIFADSGSALIYRCQSLNITGSCDVIASDLSGNTWEQLKVVDFKCNNFQTNISDAESTLNYTTNETNQSTVSNATAAVETQMGEISDSTDSFECVFHKDSFEHTFVAIFVTLIVVLGGCLVFNAFLLFKVLKQRPASLGPKTEQNARQNENYGETYADLNVGNPISHTNERTVDP